MGLDMFLHQRVSGFSISNSDYKIVDKNNKCVDDIVIKNKDGEIMLDIPLNSQDFYISKEVIYLRKANHIHKWFVDNVQNGVDDCNSYGVSYDKLMELKNICDNVIKSKDDKLSKNTLPTQNGFFFGPTEYGEYYYESTLELYNALNNIKNFGYFYYESSW